MAHKEGELPETKCSFGMPIAFQRVLFSVMFLGIATFSIFMTIESGIQTSFIFLMMTAWIIIINIGVAVRLEIRGDRLYWYSILRQGSLPINKIESITGFGRFMHLPATLTTKDGNQIRFRRPMLSNLSMYGNPVAVNPLFEILSKSGVSFT